MKLYIDLCNTDLYTSIKKWKSISLVLNTFSTLIMKLMIFKPSCSHIIGLHRPVITSPVHHFPLIYLSLSFLFAGVSSIKAFNPAHITRSSSDFTWFKPQKVFLPSIHKKDLFLVGLKQLLESLPNGSCYKLDFCLFLHTNDSSKKLEYFLSPDSGIENPNDPSLFIAFSLFYKMYKLRGYEVCHSINVNVNNDSINKICNSVYEALGSYVVSVNETLDRDGFIEFKKSTLVKTYHIPD